jgi:ketosteroid isomerase-like protein
VSQENVQIVRAGLDAFNRGEVDAAFEDFAPDFEFDMSRAIGININRDVYDLRQFRRLLDEFTGTWGSFRPGGGRVHRRRGGHVVTPFTNRVSGRDGIELQARGTWVWTIRDGAVVRACLFQEFGEALEAAGLRE